MFFRGSSPLTRGARIEPLQVRDAGRIIPAHAGSTIRADFKAPIGADHPRSRGEHLLALSGSLVQCGSSPLTRGAPGTRCVSEGEPGIIPAHAGSTMAQRLFDAWQGDHPRSRGEHVDRPWDPCPHRGSSPLTRGAPRLVVFLGFGFGIIPAHAGSTSQASAS